jgi:hypothetical protein
VAEEKTRQYRYVGSHADVLADGRPIGPGEFIDLTDDQLRDPFYEDRLANGVIIGTEDEAEHQQKLATRRVERREDKTTAPTEGEES